MSVKVIYKQPTDKAHEVTDKMLDAADKAIIGCPYIQGDGNSRMMGATFYKAMEAARVAECGDIERIDILSHPGGNEININILDNDRKFIKFYQDNDSIIMNIENIRPLANALIELDKQINEWK